MSELPKWPREFRRGETVNEWKAAEYERARAEAALERLRVAVEALMRVGSFSIALGRDGANVETMHAIHGCLEEAAGSAIEALAQIGEIPEA